MKSFFLLLVLIPISLQIEHCLIERLVCKNLKPAIFYLKENAIKFKIVIVFLMMEILVSNAKMGIGLIMVIHYVFQQEMITVMLIPQLRMEQLRFAKLVKLDIKRKKIIHVNQLLNIVLTVNQLKIIWFVTIVRKVMQ